VIPEIVERIIKQSEQLKLSKLELPIQGDGQETRAFCYVDDGAEGFRIAGTDGGSGEVYHLGVTEEVKIADLILGIGRVLNIDLTLVPGELRPGGTTRRCPSIDKLASLGYQPQVSLSEGIERTVKWYADYFLKEGDTLGDSRR
jgi:UDP-glucose 4-epimerase